MATKEDSFLTLKQQIKSKNTGNLYLFFGEEIYIKNTYMKIMTDLVPDDGFGDFNRIFIDGKDTDIEKIDDAINAFPMMSEKKLIVIKNSGIFKKSSEEIKDFWLERLGDVPDYVLLIFDEQEVDCIYSESFATPRIGQAIMNRLLKAAGYQVLYV